MTKNSGKISVHTTPLPQYVIPESKRQQAIPSLTGRFLVRNA